MKKKLLSVLLALVMVLTLLPVAAFAEDTQAPGSGTGEDTSTGESQEGGETGGDGKQQEPAGTKDDPIFLTSKSAGNNQQIKLDPGKYYTLNEDISGVNFIGLWGDYAGNASGETYLDLNNHKITAVGNGYPAIYLATGSLNITGSGQLIGGSSDKVHGAISVAGESQKKLTIGKDVTVTAEANQYCIVVEGAADKTTNQAEIILDGCTLNSKGSGITVNGLVTQGTQPKITLQNGTKIEAKEHGIYQAGKSEITITNAEIKAGDVGVETRNGTLNVGAGAVITGGTGKAGNTPNGNGSTAQNAGIAVAQHTTKGGITVNVSDGAEVSGGSALYVVNPQANEEPGDLKVTVDGEATKLTATNENGHAIFNQAPVDVVVKGGTIDGNVAMSTDEKNAGKGGIDITNATVNGNITNGSDDGAAVSVRASTVTGEIEGVGIVVDCKDADGKPIENVNNANTALKAETDKTFGNSFPQMWDVKVSGLQNDKYYLIRVAAKGISTTADGNSIIIALNNPAAGTYTVTCKPGQNVTVFELEAKPTDWTGTIQTLTEYEMTVPGENG